MLKNQKTESQIKAVETLAQDLLAAVTKFQTAAKEAIAARIKAEPALKASLETDLANEIKFYTGRVATMTDRFQAYCDDDRAKLAPAPEAKKPAAAKA